jgi:DNA end-binding protein Ku
MAPRSVFNATVCLAGINVPVKLFTATENKRVSFKQVHATDGSPIEHRRIDPESGETVPYSDVVKGYEVGEGEFVELTKDEVKAAAGERTKAIPIEDFVDAEAIAPEYFDKTYYLGAREGGEEAYRVLQEALERTGRAGIGRMTFHDREYLVAVRALDDVLGLHTMRFGDEVVDPDDVELSRPEKGPSKREVSMAGALVESLGDDWKPEEQPDEHRERVLALVEAKASGKQIVQEQADEPGDSSDLLAALEASIKGSRKGKG